MSVYASFAIFDGDEDLPRPRQPVAAVRAVAGAHLALRALLDGPR